MLIWADHPDSEPMPPNFAILPDEGQISFSLGDRGPDSPEQVWTNQAAIDRAWDCLSQLHIDQAQFVKKNAAPAGTWGVFFPRHIEGFPLYDQSQGFSFQQFGKEGKIRCFDLMFPNLQRQQFEATASAQQIIACIRKFKTPSPPEGNEPNYFARIKNLAKARKVTIIGIIPFYAEGRFGEHLKEQEI
jgi:hypothetical protein